MERINKLTITNNDGSKDTYDVKGCIYMDEIRFIRLVLADDRFIELNLDNIAKTEFYE